MSALLDKWLSRASSGDFSFLEERGFDAGLLGETLDNSDRLLSDQGALDNFCRAQVCLAMGDPMPDERLIELSIYQMPTPYPTLYQLLCLLKNTRRLGEMGQAMLDNVRMFLPSYYAQEGAKVLPFYQLVEFAKMFRNGRPLKEFREFFFQPLAEGYGNRLARYVIGIEYDPLIEQALRDSSMEEFFEDKETAIYATLALLRLETDRLMLFQTVRYLWQQICLPRNTFLSKFKPVVKTWTLSVPYADLGFNPAYRLAVQDGLLKKHYTDKLATWFPDLKNPAFKPIIACWGKLLIPPVKPNLEVQLKQQVNAFLSTEGQSGWCVALLWLLGIVQ